MDYKLISTREAAKLLGCSERTVRNMIRRKSLKAVKVDPWTKSVYQVSLPHVEEILKARERATKIRK